MIVTLPPATRVMPSSNASVKSLSVGVPLGSSTSTDMRTFSNGSTMIPPPKAEIGTRSIDVGNTSPVFKNCVR